MVEEKCMSEIRSHWLKRLCQCYGESWPRHFIFLRCCYSIVYTMGGSRGDAASLVSIQKREWLESLESKSSIVHAGRQPAAPAKKKRVAASSATSKRVPKAKSIAAGRGAGHSRQTRLPKLGKLKQKGLWSAGRHPLVWPPNVVPGSQQTVPAEKRKVPVGGSTKQTRKEQCDGRQRRLKKTRVRAKGASGAEIHRGRKCRVQGLFGARHWIFPEDTEAFTQKIVEMRKQFHTDGKTNKKRIHRGGAQIVG